MSIPPITVTKEANGVLGNIYLAKVTYKGTDYGATIKSSFAEQLLIPNYQEHIIEYLTRRIKEEILAQNFPGVRLDG